MPTLQPFLSLTDYSRSQVGIGTLIIFIAMVLVATIAGGVLINTAGFLQSQSEETGEESTQQVSDRVQVFSSIGVLGGNNIDGNMIVRESTSATSDIDGVVWLEEAVGSAAQDDIDDNVVTEDGRNVIAVNGNIVTSVS